MDQTTHTPRHLHAPKHRDGRRAPNADGDYGSLAADPPPAHPDGLVVGRRRRPSRVVQAALQVHQVSEAGAAVAWLLTAVWMVGLLMVGVYGFLRVLEQAAATR